LIQPGNYHLHSRFTHAINFVDGDALMAVVDSSVGSGPVNIVTDDLTDWGIGNLEIGTGYIRANGQEIQLQDVPRYDSSLRMPENTDSTLFKGNHAVLRGHLIGMASEESLAFLLDENPVNIPSPGFENALRSRFIEAAGLLRNGKLQDAVPLVKGLGRGLTPQGDDFIAGLLFALHLRGQAFAEPVELEIKAILSPGHCSAARRRAGRSSG
jgi:hypothetical protein